MKHKRHAHLGTDETLRRRHRGNTVWNVIIRWNIIIRIALEIIARVCQTAVELEVALETLARTFERVEYLSATLFGGTVEADRAGFGAHLVLGAYYGGDWHGGEGDGSIGWDASSASGGAVAAKGGRWSIVEAVAGGGSRNVRRHVRGGRRRRVHLRNRKEEQKETKTWKFLGKKANF